jgi:predicted nucleotidyltransferase
MLVYVLPSSLVKYLPYFYIIQGGLILNYIRLFIVYLKFQKFLSYEEARLYYFDLKRVKKLEQKAKKVSIKKAKEEILAKQAKLRLDKKIKEDTMKTETINILKLELEERKKKVL